MKQAMSNQGHPQTGDTTQEQAKELLFTATLNKKVYYGICTHCGEQGMLTHLPTDKDHASCNDCKHRRE